MRPKVVHAGQRGGDGGVFIEGEGYADNKQEDDGKATEDEQPRQATHAPEAFAQPLEPGPEAAASGAAWLGPPAARRGRICRPGHLGGLRIGLGHPARQGHAGLVRGGRGARRGVSQGWRRRGPLAAIGAGKNRWRLIWRNLATLHRPARLSALHGDLVYL